MAGFYMLNGIFFFALLNFKIVSCSQIEQFTHCVRACVLACVRVYVCVFFFVSYIIS